MNIDKKYSNIAHALNSYRLYANKFHETNHFPFIDINDSLIDDLSSAQKNISSQEYIKALKSMSSILKAQLATPWILDNNPIIDAISLTISVTESEAIELSKAIQCGNFAPKQFYYTKKTSEGNKRPYKFQLKIRSKSDKSSFLFISLIKTTKDKDDRHLRISFNPAKTGELFINQFFGALKRTNIINKLDQRLS